MDYIVTVPVGSFEMYKVEASSEEEAKELIARGKGIPYRHGKQEAEADKNNWIVEEY